MGKLTSKEIMREYLKSKVDVPFDNYDIEREILMFAETLNAKQYYTIKTLMREKDFIVSENNLPGFIIERVNYKIKGGEKIPAVTRSTYLVTDINSLILRNRQSQENNLELFLPVRF